MAEPTNSGSRPTLLVFTLGAEGDRARSRLLPERLGTVETAFHRACLESALAAGRAADCRIAVASELDLPMPQGVERIAQRGKSFGERLRNAVADAERRADGPLLVVGTDVPDLRACHLKAALGRLDACPEQVVIGPSTDGGFYLLAARAPVAELLADVRWCRHDTLRTLVSALDQVGRSAAYLDPLSDLDHRRDLERWIAQTRGRGPLGPIVAELRRVLAALRRPLLPRRLAIPQTLLAAPCGGRAPPLAD